VEPSVADELGGEENVLLEGLGVFDKLDDEVTEVCPDSDSDISDVVGVLVSKSKVLPLTVVDSVVVEVTVIRKAAMPASRSKPATSSAICRSPNEQVCKAP
jgi:hypothetical protein